MAHTIHFRMTQKQFVALSTCDLMKLLETQGFDPYREIHTEHKPDFRFPGPTNDMVEFTQEREERGPQMLELKVTVREFRGLSQKQVASLLSDHGFDLTGLIRQETSPITGDVFFYQERKRV